MPTQPRLLIVDQSLRDLNGHHFEYDLAIAQHALMQKINVRVLAHADFREADLFGEIAVDSLFTQSFYDVHRTGLVALAHRWLNLLPPVMRGPIIGAASRLKRKLNGPQESEKAALLPVFGQELRQFLVSGGYRPEDHVLIHTLSISELHSALSAMAGQTDCPILHVVLRRDADEPGVRSGPWGAAGGAFARIRNDATLFQQVVLHTDSEALARQYREIAPDFRFHVLPIPHALSDALLSDRPRPPGPLRLTYLGNARTEKGYDLLPGLLAALSRGPIDGGRARLVVQSNFSMSAEERRIIRARRELGRYPRSQVELLDEELSQEQFQKLLLEADIVLLPYEAQSYRRRSSGILIQSLVAGKPVVVPNATWLSETAPADAATTFDGPEDFARAVSAAIERFADQDAAAKRSAPLWLQRHNAAAVVRQLIAAAPSRAPQT